MQSGRFLPGRYRQAWKSGVVKYRGALQRFWRRDRNELCRAEMQIRPLAAIAEERRPERHQVIGDVVGAELVDEIG